MNKKIKIALAAFLAACSLLNLTGCSEKNEQPLGTPDSGVNLSNAVDGDNSEADNSNKDNSNSESSDTSDTNKENSVTSEANKKDHGSESSDIGDNDKDNSAANESNTSESKTSDSDKSDNNTSNSEKDAEVVKTQYAPIKLSDNNTVNSIRLFDVMTEDKANAMFSPISLNMALGLIEAGAKGETKAALDSYLQTKNFPDLAEKYLKFVKESRNRDERIYSEYEKIPASYLEIANSVWADNALPLKDEYKQTTAKKFGAEIGNVDFAQKENTLNKINGWVSDKTHKMIPSVLSDYGDNTRAVLVNTVYFESMWSKKWSVREDRLESFTLPDGTSKQLPLMYKAGDSYFENDKATAFSSRYMNGLEFIGILPKETGEFTLESLDIPSLLASETRAYDVDAVMPRLNFETELPLNDALIAAGLENIFDENKADFSGISDVKLWVSEVLQKTKLELDENGTKAAAATVIAMAGNAMPMPKELKTVRLDRPFAFMIYDSAEQQILFIGKVAEP